MLKHHVLVFVVHVSKQYPIGSSRIRLTSYSPAGSVLPFTVKSNGIETRIEVPGSCARVVPTTSKLSRHPAATILKNFFIAFSFSNQIIGTPGE